jgi:molecular chaperone DnaK
MARSTVDFGIDLGTTNSSIAVLTDGAVDVFRNNEGLEYTPSAVWIDKNGRLYVGRQAKERLEDDVENARCEFKLMMGKNHPFPFARSGRAMQPEELSAEVLKSLKADVAKRRGEDVTAALITVPAAFELPQCNATRKAAELAGITFSPLLQEPVAAALAYGFQTKSDKVFWLVYDFGGGTFDAALIQVRDGLIQVVNHGGDNHLGGKLIDWSIVEELLIPAVVSNHPLTGFNRGNPKYISAIAKLKLEAEKAKIRLSSDDCAPIHIEFLCTDDRGDRVEFEYDLMRADLERLVTPLITRSINICRQVLSERHLGAGDIEKVLLVGGPTLMPSLRERLTDKQEGLGVPLEFSKDPLTVVAQGAAIQAGTIVRPEVPGEMAEKRQQGSFTIRFPDWKTRGSDIELVVAGMVETPAGESLEGLQVEFVDAQRKPPYRSGKISVAAKGGFMATLMADKKQTSHFTVELTDGAGRIREVVTHPEDLAYAIGLGAPDAPLTHDISLELVNNEVMPFFEKGTPLPTRTRKVLHTAFDIHKGQEGDRMLIPVLEGQNKRADRNRRIGVLEITSEQVRRDIPAGTEVEVTIEMDASRILRTKAYIPVLDEEFEMVIEIGGQDVVKSDVLQTAYQRQKSRLDEVRKQVEETGDEEARKVLQRIDDERIVHDIEHLLEASRTDPEAADKCDKRIQDLMIALDKAEESLEWPALVKEANKLISTAEDIIRDHGDADDRRKLKDLEMEIRSAMETRDPDLLRQRQDALLGLVIRVLDKKGILAVMRFQQLAERQSEMRDPTRASLLLNQGRLHIQRGETDALKAVNQELASLIPNPPPPPGQGGTLTY